MTPGISEQLKAAPSCEGRHESSMYREELIAPVCVRLTQGDPFEMETKDWEPSDRQTAGTNYSYFRYPATVDFSTIDQIEARQEHDNQYLMESVEEVNSGRVSQAHDQNTSDQRVEAGQDEPQKSSTSSCQEAEQGTEQNNSCFNSASCGCLDWPQSSNSSRLYQCNNSGNSRSVPAHNVSNRAALEKEHLKSQPRIGMAASSLPSVTRCRTFEISSGIASTVNSSKISHIKSDYKEEENDNDDDSENEYEDDDEGEDDDTKRESKSINIVKNPPVKCHSVSMSSVEPIPNIASSCHSKRRLSASHRPSMTKRKRRTVAARETGSRSAPARVTQAANKRLQTVLHTVECKKTSKEYLLRPLQAAERYHLPPKESTQGRRAERPGTVSEKYKFYRVDLCTSSPKRFRKGKEQEPLHTVISLPSDEPPRVMLTFITPDLHCRNDMSNCQSLAPNISTLKSTCPELLVDVSNGVSAEQTTCKQSLTKCRTTQTPSHFRKIGQSQTDRESLHTASKKAKTGSSKSKISPNRQHLRWKHSPRSSGNELRTSSSLADMKYKLCIPEHKIIYMDKHDPAAPQFWEELNSKLHSSETRLQGQSSLKCKDKQVTKAQRITELKVAKPDPQQTPRDMSENRSAVAAGNSTCSRRSSVPNLHDGSTTHKLLHCSSTALKTHTSKR